MNKKREIMLTLMFFSAIALILNFAVKPDPAKEVAAEALQARRLTQEISVIGNVKAKDEEEIILPSQQKVKAIFAVKGQEIKKNDILVTLDTTDLEYELNKHKLNLALATADYDEAQKKLAQNKVLFEMGAVSKEQYDNYEKQMNDQKIQIETAQLEIENIRTKISNSEIKANINGTIVRLDIKENQYPTSDNCSIFIYDLSEYKTVVEANQYDAVKIRPGQKADIRLKGLEGDYTGTVSKIDETAKIDSANKKAKVKIEIAFDHPDDRIKSGYEADVNITLSEISEALAVNNQALQREKDGREFVYLIENGKAVKNYIKTGFKTDNYRQIIGLRAGQQYIINPPEALEDGDPVSTEKES